MEDVLLQDLNEAQRAAVASDASVLQVLAPPGSGKTKTLTARVAHLIANRKLRPWNIIVCTFTVKAANEMKERIKMFVGDDLATQLKLGTFHSVALRYLKHYGHLIGISKDFGIADTTDSKAILKRIIKKFGLSMEPAQALGRISTRKVKKSPPSKVSKGLDQQDFDHLFAEYETALAASNMLDYDDLLLRCCVLLQNQPGCVSNVEAVLIDEFQDTNNTQYELMTLFAQHKNAVTVVGDPDQSIYGFRMAEIKNLSRMKNQWPDTLTINLEENYRSSGAILHAAQNIIEQDVGRPTKRLLATHAFGLRPILRRLPSAPAEAEWLVSEIKRVQALSGSLLHFSDYAILLRSAALSRVIETALSNAGIPYKMVGGTKFYDRIEVKLVIDYLRVVHQPCNNEAVERIVNVPPRRIGDETVKRLREEAEGTNVSLWRLVLDIAQGRRNARTKLSEPARKGLSTFVNVILCGRKKVATWETSQPSLVDLVSLVLQKTCLQSFLKTKYAEEETYEARWSNVEELVAQAVEMSSPDVLHTMIAANDLPVLKDLEQRSNTLSDVLSLFLANVALTTSAEKKAAENGGKLEQITISTIHAAKGLEWPVVFIPACFDGSIPHSRAEDHDEERRLLYVGMTRAQALLYLSCPVKNSQREDTTMSAFLTQPGVSAFFEEHGPSLPTPAVTNLASTLRRVCPDPETVSQTKLALRNDEDNLWPLNGEESQKHHMHRGLSVTPVANLFSGSLQATGWARATNMSIGQNVASSTVPATLPGFATATSRYEELMESGQQRKIDKKLERQETNPQLSRGIKRHVDGRSEISSFFSKRNKASIAEIQQIPAGSASTNIATRAHSVELPRVALRMPTLRSAPMLSKPLSTKPQDDQENRNDYVFLSSSPVRDVGDEQHMFNAPSIVTESSGRSRTGFRPASTFHTTAMDRVIPQRKTLGVRRSLQGWGVTRKSQ